MTGSARQPCTSHYLTRLLSARRKVNSRLLRSLVSPRRHSASSQRQPHPTYIPSQLCGFRVRPCLPCRAADEFGLLACRVVFEFVRVYHAEQRMNSDFSHVESDIEGLHGTRVVIGQFPAWPCGATTERHGTAHAQAFLSFNLLDVVSSAFYMRKRTMMCLAGWLIASCGISKATQTLS
jgi:hypothetical protein